MSEVDKRVMKSSNSFATLPLAGDGPVPSEADSLAREGREKRQAEDALYIEAWHEGRTACAAVLCDHCDVGKPLISKNKGRKGIVVFLHQLQEMTNIGRTFKVKYKTVEVPCHAAILWPIKPPTCKPGNEPPAAELVWACPDCDEVQDDPEPGYNCNACGNQFMKSDGEGRGNTCPECHKWAEKIGDHVCPNDYAELEQEDRVQDGQEWVTVEDWNKDHPDNPVVILDDPEEG